MEELQTQLVTVFGASFIAQNTAESLKPFFMSKLRSALDGKKAFDANANSSAHERADEDEFAHTPEGLASAAATGMSKAATGMSGAVGDAHNSITGEDGMSWVEGGYTSSGDEASPSFNPERQVPWPASSLLLRVEIGV
jgi:hypothetical protein